MLAKLFDDTFTYDMVGQAGKRLGADDVIDTAVDQFNHFAGQEPAFSGLVTNVYDRFCIFHRFINAARRREVGTLLKGMACTSAKEFNATDTETGNQGGLFAHAQIISFINLVVEAVEHEVYQIRHNGLCSFGF